MCHIKQNKKKSKQNLKGIKCKKVQCCVKQIKHIKSLNCSTDCFNTYQVHMFDIAQEKLSDTVSVMMESKKEAWATD